MKRIERVLWALALILALAAPAAATHITEPKRPITALTLRLYKYPDLATTAVDCSTGTHVYRFSAMRIEPFVTADPTWPDRTAPSEHYVVRTVVTGQRGDIGRPGLLWDSLWFHQNMPPHPIKPNFETNQGNTYGVIDGPGQVTVTVTGQESGNVLTTTCNFIVDVP